MTTAQKVLIQRFLQGESALQEYPYSVLYDKRARITWLVCNSVACAYRTCYGAICIAYTSTIAEIKAAEEVRKQAENLKICII